MGPFRPDRRDGEWRGGLGWAARLGRHELLLLFLLALLAAGTWGFIELADEVVEGETHAVDAAILLALRDPQDHDDPLGPAWLEELGRDFTALGGVGVLTFLTLAACGFLLLQHKRRSAQLVVIAVAGGTILSVFLKSGFDRPRPDLVPHGSIVYTASFPSGHAMMAATVYLTLGVLLARTQRGAAVKAYLLALAILLTIAVGVSRVYLGVHWPSDVLAGWTAGAGWAMLCWLLAHWLQHRGKIEPESR